MNILISGGLLVLGVVAILGAILLSRSGETSGPHQKNTPVVEPAAQTNLIDRSGRADAIPTGPTADAAQMAQPTMAAATGPAQPLLNGQIHELAGEVRTLHQQAWQLEQRLSALAEMVNQVERAQQGYGGEEEETRRYPSDSTAG